MVSKKADQTGMSGIFDIFKKRRSPKETAPQPSGLPILAPEQPQETLGLIEQIRMALIQPPPPPTTGLLQRAAELFAPPAEPAELTALDKALQVFQPPPPPAMPPPPEAPPAPTIAEVLVPEPMEQESIEAFLQAVALPVPSHPTPTEAASAEWRRHVIEAMERQPPAWLLTVPPPPQAPWKIPTKEEMAALLARKIEGLNEWLRNMEQFRATQDFALALTDLQRWGRPFTSAVVPVAYRELYQDLHRFFEIPWEVFESYFAGVRTQQEQDEAERRLWEEIITPIFFRVTEAMEMLKPPSLPGWFAILRDEATGTYWLYYVEAITVALPKPPPGVWLLPFKGRPSIS